MIPLSLKEIATMIAMGNSKKINAVQRNMLPKAFGQSTFFTSFPPDSSLA